MKRIYDLRCVFEYVSKPTWRSQWNRTGEMPCDAAYMQSKEGLLYAVIEGKHIETCKTVRLVECPGQDFCNFSWVAASAIPLGGGTVIQREIGLSLATRNENIVAFYDGTISVDKCDNANDTTMHFGRLKL